MPALFGTSKTQTARHKMGSPTAVFSRISIDDFEQGQVLTMNPQKDYCVYFLYPILVDRVPDASSFSVALRP